MEQISEFAEYLLEEEKSDNTISNYTRAAKDFFSRYDTVTKGNMIEFKKYMIAQKSAKTASVKCIAMNRYCDFIGKPECKVKHVKIHKENTLENVITNEQYMQLLDGLKKDGNEKGYWMIKFLAMTGARVSEFVQLDKQCLKTGVFELWTKGKVRRILIPDRLIEESRAYFQTVEGEYLFNSKVTKGRMTSRGVSQNIKNWARKYGIPKEVAYPHSFRHLYAINFLKRNGNIALLSDLMGHESVETTAIYLRLSAEEQKEQFNAAVDW